MSTVVIDVETFSAADLKSCGLHRYMEDPSFELLLVGYAFDDGEVRVADLVSGDPFPEDLKQALLGGNDVLVAHNAAFERAAFARYFGQPMPPERWRDTMIMAASCGLPLSLDAATKALGFGEDTAKDARGKALIKLFSCPHKPTKTMPQERVMPQDEPEKWQTYVEYNRQDVIAERALFNTLKRFMPDEREWMFWCLDQNINDHGIKFDRTLAAAAQQMGKEYKEELTRKAVELTGLENPKSVSQIKTWLFDQEGKEFPSLNKKVIAEVVSQLSTDKAKEFMAIRSELSKSADNKYTAMLRAGCSDDHIRGCFQFFGGHTGRFAGRLVQLQNLKQNKMQDLAEARALVRSGDLPTVEMLYNDVSGTLGELVRTALIPETGQRFVVSDFSAIEARVTAWMAHEQWRLEAFRSGKDIYCASASMMFGVPVEKHGVNGELRQKGKIAELALGYGGGINALKAFGADKMGLTDEDMVDIVDKWRGASPNIVKMWKSMEAAAIRAIVRKTPTRCEISNVTFEMEGGILWMRLPSGRRMAYYGAEYSESTLHSGRKTLSYMTQEQQSKKWSRTETWGGKLVENCLAEGTKVKTLNGWKSIETVTDKDFLWDGQQWVRSLGAVLQGTQPVLSVSGVLMTPDHKILTSRGWQRAKYCDGLDGLQVRSESAGFDCGTQLYAKVYDILNAGANHCFTVLGEDGREIVVHNCVQAFARDILREKMLRIAEKYQIVAHVHDEVIVTVPADEAEAVLADIGEIMGEEVPWAQGLPLRGDGYTCEFYMKD